MNNNDLKLIPIEFLAEALGARYSHTDRKSDKWYYSPFRPDERTASFKIDTKKNRWHDFGLANTGIHRAQGSGGDIYDLWCDYNFKDRRLGFKEAGKALERYNFAQREERLLHYPRKEKSAAQDEEPRYRILKTSSQFTHYGLLDEINRRRVSKELASLYFKQGHVEDTVTGKKYYGFLFENDKGGFEFNVPNPKKGENFKTCIGQKASTRILIDDDRNAADVFEGGWDFVTWLQMKAIKRPINHSYILNSTSLTGEVCQNIIAFNEIIKYAFLFMDNDEAGNIATFVIDEELEQNGVSVASLAQFYSGYKDLSDFRMKKPLTLKPR